MKIKGHKQENHTSAKVIYGRGRMKVIYGRGRMNLVLIIITLFMNCKIQLKKTINHVSADTHFRVCVAHY
jgi:hypothetical protein